MRLDHISNALFVDKVLQSPQRVPMAAQYMYSVFDEASFLLRASLVPVQAHPCYLT